MKIKLSRTTWAITAALLGVSTLAYCAPYDYWGLRKIDFEMTGQVFDFDTKQPIEGAYVLAVYEKVDLGFAASARFCVKTKGMPSDKEGRFHFPVEKLDSYSPSQLGAIKENYYFYRDKQVSHQSTMAQNKETYSHRDVYLKKQDPAKPELRYGYDKCERPDSREAVESNIEFLMLQKAEATRLASDFDWFKRWIASTDNLIGSLQSATRSK